MVQSRIILPFGVPLHAISPNGEILMFLRRNGTVVTAPKRKEQETPISWWAEEIMCTPFVQRQVLQ